MAKKLATSIDKEILEKILNGTIKLP